MTRTTILATLGVVVALAGCGGGASSHPGSASSSDAIPEQPSAKTTISDADLRKVLKINLEFDDPTTGCQASVLLTSPGAVSLYADAGDPVASNPSRTAGVKYGGGTRCYRIFTDRLKALR